jgi:phosphonate transport system permease protein
MDKQQEVARIYNGMKILFWLGFFVFFVYSFQTIMDLEKIANHQRQESFFRVLMALLQPNIFKGETSHQVAVKMWETIQIAFLATTISTVFAFPFTFISARPSSIWRRGLNILLQPILSIIRAIHPLIAIIPAIVFVGIGPTAGVLALTLFSTAVLMVDFSEYAQLHTSLSWPVLFKIYFPALALKRFPINILIATVLGFMGGGGIGFFLQQNIFILNYRDVSVAILACIIVIGSLDLLSRIIWHKIQNPIALLSRNSEIASPH